MLIRIVKMSFEPSKTETFLRIFKESKIKIRAMEGCTHLELLQDYNQPNGFSTYSYWVNEEALNNYRNSELFKKVWSTTKALFNEKPIAFSLKQHTLVE